MAENSQNGSKTVLEKEKSLVKRDFSFSHSVFKRLVKKKRFVWETVISVCKKSFTTRGAFSGSEDQYRTP